MRDFLRGTIGKVLQVILVVLGIMFVVGGIFAGSIVTVVIGILCWCIAFGIRYWLGHIIRYKHDKSRKYPNRSHRR